MAKNTVEKLEESSKCRVTQTEKQLPEKAPCWGCGLPICADPIAPHWSCDRCRKVFLCSHCFFCDKGHALALVIDLAGIDPAYTSNSYSCNSCRVSQYATDIGVWHCSTCSFDLCPKCSKLA